MKKRIFSLLLAVCMVCGLLPAMAMPAAAVEAPSGYTTDENGIMAYKYGYGRFDIRGYFDGEWKSTTYNDGGYYTFLKQGGSAESIVANSSADGGYTQGNLNVAIDFVFTNNGQTMQILYTVTNVGTQTETFSLGTGADIQIGDDDKAVITPFDDGSGYKMVSDDADDYDSDNDEYAQFNFFATGYKGVTDVSDYWCGPYNSSYSSTGAYWSGNREAAVFYGNDVSESGTFDSAASWHWADQTLPAGETATYSVLIGIGGAESEDNAESSNHSHPACGDSSCTDTAHTVSGQWLPVTYNESTLTFMAGDIALGKDYYGAVELPAGNYYLDEDIAFNEDCTNFAVESGAQINLCLNGHTLTGNGSNDAIDVEDGAKLTLCDCRGGGKVDGQGEDAVYILSDNASFDLCGGTLTGENGIYANGNKINIAISGGTVTGSESGIRYHSTGAITVSGGAVSATGGHGIYNSDRGTVTVTGGTVKGAGDYCGIYVGDGALLGSVTVTGGTVMGGKYGISSDDDEKGIFLSDAPTITGTQADIYLGGFSFDPVTFSVVGTLTGSYRVETENIPVVDEPIKIAEANDTDHSSHFAPVDPSKYEIIYDTEDKCLYLAAKAIYYTVIFDANGGSGTMADQKIDAGTATALTSNAFTKAGYDFKGWATAADGEKAYSDKETVTDLTSVGGSITLYAVWKMTPAEMPAVTVSDNLILTYGEYTDQKITATVQEKDGYTYAYQWIDGYVVINRTDTLTIPDDLVAGQYDYYLAVGARRVDNGQTAWYENGGILVTVNPKALDATNVALSQDVFTYNGSEQKPAVTVTVGGKTLTENTDYRLSWPADCTNAGDKTVAVTFMGNYTGTAQMPFTIQQKEIDISWGATAFLPYTGSSLVPEAAATNLENGDTCTLTTGVVETAEGAGIIPGTWTAKVTALSNPNYKLPASGQRVTATFEIINGYQNYAPAVSGTNETIDGKADGKITGTDTTMEYRKEGEVTYTAVSGAEVTGLADGTYYVRYAAKTYFNPSPEAQVTIGAGRKLTVTVPQSQIGYTLTVDKTEIEYMGGPTVTLTVHDGYSKTENFAVKLNGTDMQWGDFTQLGTQGCTEDVVITVEGIADITAPLAQITITDSSWTNYWTGVTFGLFYNETQSVTVTATDNGSGVNGMQYYLASGEMTLDEVKQIPLWQDYTGAFQIDPDNAYVVYAKVTDNAGNILYLNSDGVVLDQTVPVLVGIENGENYYGDKRFKALDEYLDTLKVDSVDVTGEMNGDNEYTIVADNAEHIVTATDKAGNVTQYQITVYKNYTVTYKADGQVVDTQSVGHGQDAVAPGIPGKTGYDKVAPYWEADGTNITADTEINAVYTVNTYTVTYKADGQTVDTQSVEHGKDAAAPVIPAKEGYTQTAPYWEADGTNITADTEINAVYTVNVYTVTLMADGQPVGTLTVNHGEAATLPAPPAKEGYTAAWDRTIVFATSDITAHAVYTPIPVTPSTGDNFLPGLWIAVMAISAAALAVLLIGQKRRAAK